MHIDSGFLRRTCWATLWFAPLIIGAAAARGYKWSVLAGLALGTGITLASFLSLEWAVGRAMRSSGRQKLLTGMLLVKLPVLGALFFLALVYGKMNAGALAAGLAIPYVVLVLRLLGRAATAPKSEPK